MLASHDTTWNRPSVLNLGLSYSSLAFNVAAKEGLATGRNAEIAETSHRRRDSSEQRTAQLYDELRPALYRYLINVGMQPQDVEEIVQETFLRLYRHMCAGGDEENLRGWVYQVAHNISANLRKSRRRLVETTPELWEQLSTSVSDLNPNPEEQLLKKERFFRFHEGLASLTQLQRDCLCLRVEGFRYREIAEMLDVGISTVAGSLRNALGRLMKERL